MLNHGRNHDFTLNTPSTLTLPAMVLFVCLGFVCTWGVLLVFFIMILYCFLFYSIVKYINYIFKILLSTHYLQDIGHCYSFKKLIYMFCITNKE